MPWFLREIRWARVGQRVRLLATGPVLRHLVIFPWMEEHIESQRDLLDDDVTVRLGDGAKQAAPGLLGKPREEGIARVGLGARQFRAASVADLRAGAIGLTGGR